MKLDSELHQRPCFFSDFQAVCFTLRIAARMFWELHASLFTSIRRKPVVQGIYKGEAFFFPQRTSSHFTISNWDMYCLFLNQTLWPGGWDMLVSKVHAWLALPQTLGKITWAGLGVSMGRVLAWMELHVLSIEVRGIKCISLRASFLLMNRKVLNICKHNRRINFQGERRE